MFVVLGKKNCIESVSIDSCFLSMKLSEIPDVNDPSSLFEFELILVFFIKLRQS